LPSAAVRISVGGDDLPVDQPGDLDGEVFVGVEHAGQPGVLAGREQVQAGAGDASDAVEGIAGVAAAAEGVLLDPLADQIQLGPGQGRRHRRGPSP
jgi:hypothetical protein